MTLIDGKANFRASKARELQQKVSRNSGSWGVKRPHLAAILVGQRWR